MIFKRALFVVIRGVASDRRVGFIYCDFDDLCRMENIIALISIYLFNNKQAK